MSPICPFAPLASTPAVRYTPSMKAIEKLSAFERDQLADYDRMIGNCEESARAIRIKRRALLAKARMRKHPPA